MASGRIRAAATSHELSYGIPLCFDVRIGLTICMRQIRSLLTSAACCHNLIGTGKLNSSMRQKRQSNEARVWSVNPGRSCEIHGELTVDHGEIMVNHAIEST